MRGVEWILVGSKAINLANVASVDLEARPVNRGEAPAVVISYAVSMLSTVWGEPRQILVTERFVGPDADAIRAFFAAMTDPRS
jgi:hypothetical protein